jgi:hypothetical protein
VVGGRVLDPAGNPVKGARVYLLYLSRGKPKVRATTGADGRFRFTTTEADFRAYPDPNPWQYATIMAFAKGYGPAAPARPGKAEAARDVQLRLVKDDVPVKGRILDLQGHPVKGATVQVQTLMAPAKGDLTAWLTALKGSRDNALSVDMRLLTYFPNDLGKYFPTVKTGADGRFQLRGLGRERVAQLRIEGPTIETRLIHVRTRPGDPILARLEAHNPGGERRTYYGADFTYAAGPTLPVSGVVRDKDTGKPLAGVLIQSEILAGNNVMGNSLVSTTTDKQGRYHLTGLPRRKGNQIKAVPADEQPYLHSVRPVPNPFGTKPVTIDFSLKRGVVVSGRVTDKATGKPVAAGVEYFVFADNPYRKEAAGFTAETRFYTRPDGLFRVVVLPGRGILACRAGDMRYVHGFGADKIKGVNAQGSFPTFPYSCWSGSYNTVAEVNPDKKAVSLTCDLVVTEGRSLAGTVLGPDNKPLAGAQVAGLTENEWGGAGPPLKTAVFQVRNLVAGRSRTVIVRHTGKRLAGYATLRGDEKGPVRVKLQPWAVVTGRLVDEDGQPRKGANLLYWSAPSLAASGLRTDKEGKFRLEGLTSGLKYSLAVVRVANVLEGRVFQDLTVKPGQIRDLGDVRAK